MGHAEKLDDATKEEINKAVEEAKALPTEGASLEDIKAKSEALSTASMKIGQAMYGEGGENAGEGAGESSGDAPQADEAEFKEKEQNPEEERKKRRRRKIRSKLW